MNHSYHKFYPGWAPLIDRVVESADAFNQKYPQSGLKIVDIKEKFGGLRIYFNVLNLDNPGAEVAYDEFAVLVAQIIDQADLTCQDCSNPGRLYSINEWEVTLCTSHYDERCKKADRENHD